MRAWSLQQPLCLPPQRFLLGCAALPAGEG
jgi:hypothetical protein